MIEHHIAGPEKTVVRCRIDLAQNGRVGVGLGLRSAYHMPEVPEAPFELLIDLLALVVGLNLWTDEQNFSITTGPGPLMLGDPIGESQGQVHASTLKDGRFDPLEIAVSLREPKPIRYLGNPTLEGRRGDLARKTVVGVGRMGRTEYSQENPSTKIRQDILEHREHIRHNHRAEMLVEDTSDLGRIGIRIKVKGIESLKIRLGDRKRTVELIADRCAAIVRIARKAFRTVNLKS